MKPIHATLLLMAGLLVLMNSPLRAQEKQANPPGESPVPSGVPSQPAPPPPPMPRGERPHGPQSRSPEVRSVPFIGVLTTSVSPDLRAQFDLQDGFGLQVVEVMPDSPAKAAGLKEHDVLLTMDDQKLVNMEQLQTLVRSKKKDDQVNFAIITGGQRSQLTIKIGEHMMPMNPEDGRGRGGHYFPMNPRGYGYGYDRQDNYRDTTRALEETIERFQERMRDYQKRLGEWSRDRSGEMPTLPSFDGGRHREGNAPRSEDRNGPGSRTNDHRESHQNGSVSRRDESGEYLLRREDDKTVFTVRPKDGAERSWNINNESERNSIPEPFRDKLKMLEDIRNDMHRDGTPGSPGDRGPQDGGQRRPAPDKPHDGPPPPGDATPRKGGTI